ENPVDSVGTGVQPGRCRYQHSMDSRTVTFGRRGAILVLTREQTADGLALVAIESGRRRTFPFSDSDQLARFEHDMEELLRRTGWCLESGPVAVAAAAEPPPVAVTAAADDNILRLKLEEEEVAARD